VRVVRGLTVAVNLLVISAALMVAAVSMPPQLEIATHRAVISSPGRVDIDPVSGRVEELRIAIPCYELGLLRLTVGAADMDPDRVPTRSPVRLEGEGDRATLGIALDGSVTEVGSATYNSGDPDCLIRFLLHPEGLGTSVELLSGSIPSVTSTTDLPPDTRSVDLIEYRTPSGSAIRERPVVLEVDVVVLEEAGYSALATSLRGAASILLALGIIVWWRRWPVEAMPSPR